MTVNYLEKFWKIYSRHLPSGKIACTLEGGAICDGVRPVSGPTGWGGLPFSMADLIFFHGDNTTAGQKCRASLLISGAFRCFRHISVVASAMILHVTARVPVSPDTLRPLGVWCNDVANYLRAGKMIG